MKSRLPLILFFGLLFVVLWYFARQFTLHLKLVALVVLGIGIVVLLLARRAKEESLLQDLLRDIGIAFIVAVVVTVVYEHSTRSIEEREAYLRGMTEFVPKSVWEDVKEEVLHRQRMRRNVEIEFKISRKARLSTGTYISAPPGQVILWMKYGYDLYAIGPGAASERVQHQLGYEMWNPDLEIPRFEKVTLIRDNGQKEDLWEGERLKRIIQDWSIILAPDIVQLPAARLHQPVRIVSERYELMCAPGSYNLVMPELTVRADGSNVPTIKVAVTELPPDLEFRLDTFYAEHKFDPAGSSDNSWVYTNVVLPGQGFSLIVQPKPKVSIGAPLTTH
jgi:hypothetical protein